MTLSSSHLYCSVNLIWIGRFSLFDVKTRRDVYQGGLRRPHPNSAKRNAMQKSTQILLALAVLLSLSALGFAQEADEKDVVVLTDKTFDAAVKANSKMLVEFYAPWCGE